MLTTSIVYNIITGDSKKFIPLIGMKCTYAIKFFENYFFWIQKCNITENQKKLLCIITQI